MRVPTALRLAFFVSCVVTCQEERGDGGDATLELLQIVFRHGDRTASKVFPTDPNAATWDRMGLEQLTNIGKLQHFRLGQYVKRKYSGYLNDSFRTEENYVRSSDVDRTLMSAQCSMAGMFPPNGSDIWNDELLWQPVPVHTVPIDLDYEFDTKAPCPRYDRLLQEQMHSPEMEQIDRENADVYSNLTELTGMEVSNITTVRSVYDNLVAAMLHNLTIPDWLTPELGARMRNLSDLQMQWRSKTAEMRRLVGGPTWGALLRNIRSRVDGTLPEKLKSFFFYSHDVIVAALLSALRIYNGVSPPYACSLVVQLWNHSTQGHVVQFLFRNTTESEPFVLTVPNCTAPCPLDTLAALTADVIPSDVIAECEV